MANILLVEDEREVVTLIRYILEKDGHLVTECYNGREALAALGIDPPQSSVRLPDVILMDVMMPVMDGYTAASKLNEVQETRSIPLIVLTAKGQMREVFQVASNVAGYLAKPFDPQQLRDMVNKALATKKK